MDSILIPTACLDLMSPLRVQLPKDMRENDLLKISNEVLGPSDPMMKLDCAWFHAFCPVHYHFRIPKNSRGIISFSLDKNIKP